MSRDFGDVLIFWEVPYNQLTEEEKLETGVQIDLHDVLVSPSSEQL